LGLLSHSDPRVSEAGPSISSVVIPSPFFFLGDNQTASGTSIVYLIFYNQVTYILYVSEMRREGAV
jgi:hypothetical protein